MKTYLMCGDVSSFADDVHTTCARCGAAIVHRPHVPANAVPMCNACTLIAMAMEGGGTFEVTAETRRELALYYAKTRGAQ